MLLLEILLPILVILSFYGLGAFSLICFKHNQNVPFEIKITLGASAFTFLVGCLIPFTPLNLVNSSIIFLGFSLGLIYIFKEKLNNINTFISELIPLYIYLLIMFIFSIYPSQYPDPLNYHLVGIITWVKENKLIDVSERIPLAHISYGDYLYFPLTILNNFKTNNELIRFQTSSQILHYFLGIFLFSCLLYRILKRSFEKKWVVLFILATLCRASFQHKAIIAKNDWFALSWFLSGIWFLVQSDTKFNKINICLAGFLIGIAVGSKFSYLVAFIFATIVFFRLKLLRSKNDFAFFIFNFSIALLPYFIRNYIWTQNPIFPIGSFILGKEFLGPSWIRGLKNFDVNLTGFKIEWLSSKIHRFFSYDIYTYFLLIPLFFFNKLKTLIKYFYVIICLTFIFFTFFTGEFSEIRHLGPLALLINILGIYSIYQINIFLKIREKYQALSIGIVYIIIIYNIFNLNEQISPIPKSIRNNFSTNRNFSLTSSNIGLQTSNFLLGKKYDSSTKLAVIDDTPMYFLTHFNAIKIWDDYELDKEINSCNDLKCVLNTLKRHQFIYILETGTLFDPYYNPNIYFSLINLIDHKKVSVIFTSGTERLIDVDLLLENKTKD